ncbi:unnamed protein product [Commensalibacter communis]|uniref:AfsA-related hotdog domain-containing protein n=1 Tax=Commensalibacter communis TaxID=2972786 RepID=UPI0022FF70F5|nr:AfsA-related hotdog domain-containing protein [Commensalibacter communis]CAI3959590.1 unnamed protein product [Commensalibacter communis]
MTLVNPNIVHKNSIEDVLISTPIYLLKTKLSINEFNIFIQNNEEKIGNQLYKRKGDYYYLITIPSIIKKTETDAVAHLNINDFYQKKTNNDYEIKDFYIPIQVELELNNIYKNQYTIDINLRKNLKGIHVFSHILNIDIHNYFFYRKIHDHVPGIMLMETMRQATYYFCYTQLQIQLGDVSISISNMFLEFFSYFDSAYPIELFIIPTNSNYNLKPKHIDFTGYFYQNCYFKSKMRLQGGVMKMPIFQRLRNTKTPPSHDFKLSKKTDNTITLYNEKQEHLSAKLIQFKSESLLVEIEKNLSNDFKITQCSLPCLENKILLVKNFTDISENTILISLKDNKENHNLITKLIKYYSYQINKLSSI